MNDLFARCIAFLQQRHIEAYLVGGTVRDQLLRRESHDIDLAVPRDALKIAREVANHLGGAFYALDAERETGRIVMPDRDVIDVALMRGGDIHADLAARDFTINAMARPIANLDELIDPHRGADDLQARLIRAVSEQAFRADPVRLMRAVRIAAELNFTIAPQTRSLIRRDAPLLSQASGERARDELVKILQMDRCSKPLRTLVTSHLLLLILPHAQSDATALHGLARLEALNALLQNHPPGPGERGAADVMEVFRPALAEYLQTVLSGERTRLIVLKLAALYDDAKNFAADLRRLKFSRHEVEFARALMRHQERYAQLRTPISPLITHRFFRDTGATALGLIMLGISRAVRTPTVAKTLRMVSVLLACYTRAYEQVIAPTPLLNGAELAERFDLSGPQIGAALAALVEAQVQGTVQTREDAERYLQSAIRDQP